MSSEPTPGGGITLPGSSKGNNQGQVDQGKMNDALALLAKLQKEEADKAEAEKKAAEDAAAAASAKKEEEEATILFTAKSASIDDTLAEIAANKAEIIVQEDITTADASTPEQVVKSEKKVKILEKRNVALEEDVAGEKEDAKTDWGKLADTTQTAVGVALVGTTIGSLLKGQPDVPTPPSAGETLGELGAVAAGTEYGVNQQIGNYGANFGPDALQDPEILAEWNAADRPDFNTWVQSVMSDPSSPTARKLADMLDPLNVEAKERGRRTDEAANFYQKYDASQFQSPEMQAAQSYASGLTSDPLSMKNRGYMEQELAGNYSQGYYDDLRSDLFSGMHPGAVNTSLGMTKAAIGAESAIRGRRNDASERISRDDAMRMSYAPSYASIAASGSVDPLSLSNVGKMGIGNIEPMDPTGAFFSSFPAMEYDTALAAYQKEPTQMQKVTALQQQIQNARNR
tara:strand:+ start:305 stop:1675 length:1371 start_codon:yes stop_codon:yes gene_type:complete